MAATLTNRGGKTRRTKVAKAPYWDPAAGRWRYLPIDRSHGQMVVGVDEEGNATRPVDLYAAKGFIPLEYVNDDEAKSKLPTNWRDVLKGAAPEFAKPEADEAKGEKADGDGS